MDIVSTISTGAPETPTFPSIDAVNPARERGELLLAPDGWPGLRASALGRDRGRAAPAPGRPAFAAPGADGEVFHKSCDSGGFCTTEVALGCGRRLRIARARGFQSRSLGRTGLEQHAQVSTEN